jgi:hypothetical protein
VFGIGFARTGTTTLAECLRTLGYGHLKYREDLLLQILCRHRLDEALEVAERNESFSDWPWPLIYRDLDARFPGSKFVLTVRRDPETWVRSYYALADKRPYSFPRKLIFGYPNPRGREAEYVARYERHIAEVRDWFGDDTERLLVACWDTDPSWDDLSRFLGKPTPEVPFPHLNRSDRPHGPDAAATARAAVRASSGRVPRTIWIYWHQGWDAAPPVAKRCLETWRSHNPGWDIVALSGDNIGDHLDLDSILPPGARANIEYDALSDIVRIALLRAYGGVWVDSTLYCLTPLDDWVDDAARAGFFAFADPAPDRMVSSWFLVSEREHPLVEAWFEGTLDYWKERDRPDHYFWFHYLFGELHEKNEAFRAHWGAVPKVSADGPHRFLPYGETLHAPISQEELDLLRAGEQPVLKLTHKYDPSLMREDSALTRLLDEPD